jgi:hypothetical protein
MLERWWPTLSTSTPAEEAAIQQTALDRRLRVAGQQCPEVAALQQQHHRGVAGRPSGSPHSATARVRPSGVLMRCSRCAGVLMTGAANGSVLLVVLEVRPSRDVDTVVLGRRECPPMGHMRTVRQASASFKCCRDSCFGLIGRYADVDMGPATPRLGRAEALERHVRVTSVPIDDVFLRSKAPIPEGCEPLGRHASREEIKQSRNIELPGRDASPQPVEYGIFAMKISNCHEGPLVAWACAVSIRQRSDLESLSHPRAEKCRPRVASAGLPVAEP